MLVGDVEEHIIIPANFIRNFLTFFSLLKE